MPYIKRELRQPFIDSINELVKLLPNKPTDQQLTPLMWKLLYPLENIPTEQIDGIINYIITKLLKECHIVGAGLTEYAYKEMATSLRIIIGTLLISVYGTTDTPKESYFNYNRAIGVLTCCQLEFKRRYGNNSLMGALLIQKVIRDYYATAISKYEDKKIMENGDV
jgi:hypothetical protein